MPKTTSKHSARFAARHIPDNLAVDLAAVATQHSFLLVAEIENLEWPILLPSVALGVASVHPKLVRDCSWERDVCGAVSLAEGECSVATRSQ